MRNIAIVGAGGLGREVYCIIQKINKVEPTWNVVGFYDDAKQVGMRNEYSVILGDVNSINDYKGDLAIVIAIANGHIIERIVSKITNPTIYYPNIIAPDVMFYDERSVIMGIGNIIGIGSVISCNFNIGNFNNFSCSVTVGHDFKMGSYNAITNCCSISGNVEIGDRTFWGATSIVLPLKKVTSDTIIGAGTIVVKDIINSGTYVGNPARKIK